MKIENYSNMLLSDAQVEFYCTGNKGNNQKRFAELSDLPPRSQEQLEFSNGAEWNRATCGSLSWQIKQPDGAGYLVRETSQGAEGLRVGLTWYVLWKCGEGIHNQITVRTFNRKVRGKFPIN